MNAYIISILFYCSFMTSFSYSNDQFMKAAIEGNIEALKIYIASGIDVNAKYSGQTALMYAAINGQLDACRFLIKSGADIYFQDFHHHSVLSKACLMNQMGSAQLLIESMLYEPSANHKNLIYSTMLCFTKIYPVHKANLRNIFKPYFKSMIKKDNSKKVCREICNIFHPDQVFYLLHMYFPLELQLYLAATRDHNLVLVENLIAKGAGIDYLIDEFKQTTLHAAASSVENVSICQLLIKNGADINHQDAYKNSVLREASRSGSSELCELIVEYLLQQESVINVKEEIMKLRSGHIRDALLKKLN